MTKLLELANDPKRERPGEAETAARMGMAAIAEFAMGFVIAQGTPIRLGKIDNVALGTVVGKLEHRNAPRDMRFAWGDLVHPKALALGHCCFFAGDYYLFVKSGDVVLE